MTRKLRIAFVAPIGGVAVTGGFRIIAGYAERLQRRGHKVTILAPGGAVHKPRKIHKRIAALFKRESFPRRSAGRPFLKDSDVEIKIVNNVDTLSAEHFSQADIIVATWWETAEWVARLEMDAAKIHFIQDHEVFPYLPVERAHAAHRLPLKKIAVSQWLIDRLSECYGINDATLVENAIDPEFFFTADRLKPKTPTVGFLYSVALRKNAALSIEVCRKLRQSIPDLKTISFGSHAPMAGGTMPANTDFHLLPGEAEIPSLYAKCDVWLFTSDEEGFGLPILESMACGTPVVATPAGAAPQLVNAKNGALVGSDCNEIAAAVKRIIKSSPEQWKQMSDAAIATAGRHNWTQATDMLEAAFYVVHEQKSAG